MPFINIRIVQGQSDENKSLMARLIARTIMDVTGLPEDAVWIVFEDVAAEHWYVGESSIRELEGSSP